MTKIAVFVGSLQENSINRKLAKAVERLAPEGVEFNYVDINVPLFNQDLEANYPAEATAMKSIVETADGVLFVTPEYNRSLPGVLKNAIDWTSRPWGANSFKDKPVGIMGASRSPVGTAIAQSDLRHIVAFLSMKLLGQPEVYVVETGEVFGENGELIDERWQKNLKNYIETFVAWIGREK